MTDNDEAVEQVTLNRTRLVAAILSVAGVLLALVTVGWALARVAQVGRAEGVSAMSFWEAIALSFGGVALGLLLWGIAEALRKLDNLCVLVEARREETVSPIDGAAVAPGASDQTAAAMAKLSKTIEELVAVTREVRDVSLLSESERAARVRVQGEALVRQLETAIPSLLQEHRWVEARRRVQQARERFPTIDRWDALEAQIEELRSRAEAHDVESTARQVDDLAALGAWGRAMGVLRELLERHPDSAAAKELAQRVRIRRDKADAEQRARLMAQAQEAVSRREWNRALGLANDVIRRFPRSSEADALRQQLPTLLENAEIHTRQQMEAEFRELMKGHRYEAALRLAHELVDRYPNSPQAEVLREQLPRLEERVAAL